MTSSSKDQTENTPPSSSEENIAVKGQPSRPSANSENTLDSTPITDQPLMPIKSAEKLDDKVRQHAEIARIALRQLEMNGLIRRYRVLSDDRTEVKKVILVFDNTYWTPDLELITESSGTDNTEE